MEREHTKSAHHLDNKAIWHQFVALSVDEPFTLKAEFLQYSLFVKDAVCLAVLNTVASTFIKI